MAKLTPIYYAVRSYGDYADKGVNVYRVKNNNLVCIGDFEVAWGHDAEEAVRNYVEERELAKEFFCQEL